MYLKNAKIKNHGADLIIALALILMLTLPALALNVPNAKAANFGTYAFLAVSTNPVGVNQNIEIVSWLSLPPPTAFGPFGERWQNLTITITSPDGTTTTKGPYTSDGIGQIYLNYVPTQTGNYSFQFHFPGQLSQNGNYYNPSNSIIVSLTVQQQAIQAYPNTPLPDANTYWQRPINGNNIYWTTFSGNWLALGAGFFGARSTDSTSIGVDNGNFNPFTTAPTTAHIVWTKSNGFGGVIGGNYSNPTTYYNGNSYEDQFTPPVIINGVLYYNTANPPKYGFQAVDLRTGKTLWYQNSTGQPTPQLDAGTLGGIYWPGITSGQVLNYVSVNQFGGIPYLWQTVGSVWSMYDAFTGNWILNLANASASSPTFVSDQSGDLLCYLVGSNWIAMWNSTMAIPQAPLIPGYEVWRPATSGTTDWKAGIQWNVTFARPVGGQAIVEEDANYIVTTSSVGSTSGSQMEAGYSAVNGQQLWVTNRTTLVPGSNNYGLMGPMANGIYTEFEEEKQAWYGFSAATGVQLWGPTQPTTNAWSVYIAGSEIAYGTLYSLCLDGLHAYNLTTGAHLWDFADIPSGTQTIYGVWPFELGSLTIADSKVYIVGGHSHGIQPQFAGDQMYCVNATTGTKIFSILGWMQDGWTNAPAIADGYLVTENGYDNQIYCLGKGQSATTVTVSDLVIPQGNPVFIKGSVTDQSPGQTCLGIPAAGTPAISDDSMSAWMAYLYEQQPKPTNATGVPVTLSVLDPNNNTYNIDTTTSDINGNFAVVWTPPVSGVYTITASFTGSGSYFSSYGTTSLAISQAQTSSSSSASPQPTAASTPAPSSQLTSLPSPTIAPTPSAAPSPPAAETPIAVYAAIAAAVVVIIVIAAALALRRRK